MRRILVASLISVLPLAFTITPAAAQVPPHNHLLTVPGTGEVIPVGPDRCGLGETVENGFLGFHFNVHLGEPTSTGGLMIHPAFC
jgi:hypothetical protein